MVSSVFISMLSGSEYVRFYNEYPLISCDFIDFFTRFAYNRNDLIRKGDIVHDCYRN